MESILFLDNWMIEKQTCLERVWHTPTYIKDVFTDYHPDVLGYGGYASMFWDERVDKYVMYTAVYPPEADPGTFVLRLESDDPYNWENPTYDPSIEPAWKGFQNVVVDQNGRRFWPIYINSLQGTPFADQGYLMSTYHPDRSVNESIVGTSKDGLRFNIDNTRPWQQTRADTWCGWVWNERLGYFQIHTRPVHVDRRVSIVTTKDLVAFEPAVNVLQPDAFDLPGTEFYSMPADSYEDIYIGLLHVFQTDLFEEKRRVKMAGRMETHLAYSYNGLNWYRTVRSPFIATRDYGQSGGGQVYGMETLRTREDRLLFLVHGSWGEHASYPDMQKAGFDTRGAFAPMLYDMRLDGFCSMKTWGKDGLLRTKTIIPTGGDLSLNVRTTKHTAVRVQMLDGETAEPIPGYTFEDAVPISGDHVFAVPQWQTRRDITELIGRPVRIEVKMREAELFAIRVACRVFVGTEAVDSL